MNTLISFFTNSCFLGSVCRKSDIVFILVMFERQMIKPYESYLKHNLSYHPCPFSPPPQGCRSFCPATYRAASFRRLWTTSVVNLRVSLCVRAVTAGASAAWTSLNVTVLVLIWTCWRKICSATQMP